MRARPLSLLIKIIMAIFIGGVALIVCGRNHFILGSILILFRWVLFGFGLALLYHTARRITPRQFNVALVLILLAILFEYGWNKLYEKKLKDDIGTTNVSLMTYNIFFKNQSLHSSIENIENCDPDILVIQELTEDLRMKIENSIGSSYAYKRTLALRGTHGIAVYSRYPILKYELLKDSHNRPFAQIAELKIENKKIQLINVHLASPAVAVENPHNFIDLFSLNYQLRSQQMERINIVADEKENQFSAQILMGDFNTTSYEPLYRNMRRHWVNLYEEAGSGWGATFPNSSKIDPIITLDYIFGRGAVKGMEVKVIEGGGSDHLALLGKIKI
jgi:endonuclease/exonuclease/phosphatase (EEP) superfamily protein YafD